MMTTARKITNAWIHRTLPDIFYEEPGPIEEGMRQEFTIDHIKWSLRERYQSHDDVFVSNAVFLSYDVNNGNARVRPDLFIAFGVDAATIRVHLPNFWVWETGKIPDFVMEVASPSTARNDLGPKRDLYARLGVTEYWRFDPTGRDLYRQPLTGERLVDGNYVAFHISVSQDGSQRAYSPLLNLDFYWDDAGFDVLDPATGKTIHPLAMAEEAVQTAEEAAHAAEEVARVAEEAAQTAEEAAQAAKEAAQAVQETLQATEETLQTVELERNEARSRAAQAEEELVRLREQLRLLGRE